MFKVIHHTNKSRKNLYPEVLSKNFLSKMYVTYSTLLYTQKAITQNYFCNSIDTQLSNSQGRNIGCSESSTKTSSLSSTQDNWVQPNTTNSEQFGNTAYHLWLVDRILTYNDFNQQTLCKAPICWSKYTKSPKIRPNNE